MNSKICFISIISFFVLTGIACAQTNPNLEAGFKPYGSYDAYSIDSVNVMNGNLTVKIPIVSMPQRGSVTANTYILYNNKSLTVKETCNLQTCTSRWAFPTYTSNQLRPGITLATDIGFQYSASAIGANGYYIYTVADWLGNSHLMGRSNGDPLHAGNTLYYALDGSGYMLSTPCTTSKTLCSGTVYKYKNNGDWGTPANSNGQTVMEDTNGNKITLQNSGPSVTDTVGRTLLQAPTSSDTSGCAGPLGVSSAAIFTRPGPNGGNAQIKECDATLSITTKFNALDENSNPIAELQNAATNVVQSYIVWDGNSWSTSPQWIFQYANNADGSNYGDLTEIDLPTGGKLLYTWQTVNWWDSACQVEGPGHTPASRAIVTRSLDANDGNGAQTWTYGPGTPGPPFPGSPAVAVTDPIGNQVVHTFDNQNKTAYSGCYYYEVYAQYFQGKQNGGTLLKSVQTAYSHTDTLITDVEGNVVIGAIAPSSITTIWPNGKQSVVQRDYVDANNAATVQVHDNQVRYNYQMPVGDLVEQREYDYGSGQPTKKTHYNYQAWTDGNYLNRNMLDRVQQVTVYNIAGAQVAQTVFGYDASQPQTSGAPYLDTSVGIYRGNVTSATRWVNGSSNLVSSTTYYDTGLPLQSTDVNQAATTYHYSSPDWLYVIETDMPSTGSAQHKVQGTYDFNTGAVRSVTDQNLQVSNYSYDQLGRIQSATFPDGGATSFSYPDLVTVQRTRKIDSRSTEEDAKFDGLGRLIRKATLNDQSPAYDQTDTCYFGDGTVSFRSYPYQGSGFGAPRVCSGAGDSYSYDGLQRLLTTTHSDGSTIQSQYAGAAVLTSDEGNGSTNVSRVSQYDGLGRLSSVCEVSSSNQLGLGSSYGACGQDIAQNGFLTSYGYDALGNLTSVSQGGYLSRSFAYDGLSRLISASNPESGSLSYQYDSDSNCGGSYNGDLASKWESGRSIRTCYKYDSLHRQTFKSYTDGTPSATFNYDEGTVAGHNTVYPVGHLTSETTSNTGMYFWNFDQMGRPKGMSQCTPRTCGSSYYDTAYTYDDVGDVTNTVLPSAVSLTYTYNRAARLVSIASSLNDATHPSLPLSSVSYGPFGIASEQFGNLAAQQMGYTPRGWLSMINAGDPAATPSTGTVTLNGTEQNRSNNDQTPGTGSVTISGSSDRSTQVLTQPATQSTGSVSIGGPGEQSYHPSDCPQNDPNCRVYDAGGITITLLGTNFTAYFQQGSTKTSIANQLAALINANQGFYNTFIVTVGGVGNATVQFTSRATGSGTNYPLSATYWWDSGDFPNPSFVPTAVGMSGGQDAVYTTYYDSGTTSITVNGYPKSVSYGQSDSNVTVAQNLAAAFHNDPNAPVDASASNGTVNLTSRAKGSGTNYPFTTSSQTTSQYFSGTSFTPSPSSGNLTGGRDNTYTYDSGTVTVSVNGSPTSVTYGQGSTNTNIASALNAAINAGSPLVSSTISNNVLTLTSRFKGNNTNYSLSVSNSSNNGFQPPSYSTSTASGMSGGTGASFYSTGLTYANDGDISTSSDSVNGIWNYTYDEFNRVKTGVASTLGKGCSWAYDRFGNRWQQNTYQGTCLTSSYTFNGGANRIDGGSYDGAGNYTTGGYVYDAENRLITAPGGYSYVYDAEGRRVAKKLSGTITNEYLLDSGGAQLMELDGSGNVLHTNVFANGKLFATYKNDNQTYFHFSDWLGTRRFQTNAAGDLQHTMSCTSYPFGDGLSCSGSGVDATEHHFTGKEPGLIGFSTLRSRAKEVSMARRTKAVDTELSVAAKLHLTALQIKGYSLFTIKNREFHIGLFIRWCGEKDICSARRISESVIRKYEQHVLEACKSNGEPLAITSRFARLVPIRVWLKWMKRERMISTDLSARIELPRLPRQLPHTILSPGEVECVMRRPDTHTACGLRNRAILELLYSSGLRRLEIVRLQIADLQLDRGLVLVRNGKGNRDRYVPIGKRASRWVVRYLRIARPKLSKESSGLALFLSRTGRNISSDHLTFVVRQCVAKSAVQKVGACHLFRHTLATMMHENGADIRFVQQMLGHADIRTTQIYTQVAISKLQEVHRTTHPAW